MIVSAHQPAYLPWLGYFHKILLSDIFVIVDDVQFEKNSFCNRNKIIAASQEVMLTIPVKQKGHINKTISQIEVSDHRWRKKQLKSIEQGYRKTPGFDSVFGMVASVLESEYPLLIDYTKRLTKLFLEYMEIETKILFASDLSITSRKLDYVIELTKKSLALHIPANSEDKNDNIFVFGRLGKDYAEQDKLDQAKIQPYFQDYIHPQYRQMTKSFVPYISIIDLMFNEPKEKLRDIILSGNITKSELQQIPA